MKVWLLDADDELEFLEIPNETPPPEIRKRPEEQFLSILGDGQPWKPLPDRIFSRTSNYYLGGLIYQEQTPTP